MDLYYPTGAVGSFSGLHTKDHDPLSVLGQKAESLGVGA